MLKDYFRQGRELKGWDYRRVTQELKKWDVSYSHTSIQRFEKGIIKKIPLKIINALTKIYNLDINKSYELAGLTKELENVNGTLKLKVFELESDSNGMLNNETFKEFFLISERNKISKESFVIEIKGESMEPFFFNKDKILISTHKNFKWQNLVNKIAVIEVNNVIYLKIIRVSDFKPIFCSLNAFYPPMGIKESDDVRFLGVLVKILERDVTKIKF